MRRLLVVVLLASCSTSSSAGRDRPRSQANGALEEQLATQAAQLRDATERAKAECEPLATAPVAADEVRIMGTSAAEASARRGKGLYLDGLDASPREVASKGLPKGPKNDVTAYVQVVGAWVAQGTSRKAVPWAFALVDDDDVWSSSTMSGHVLVSVGMLRLVQNEAQLAGVLAREIALVAARAQERQYMRARHAACNQALLSLYLVEAGSSSVPGGDTFMTSSKFGKTLRALAKGDRFSTSPDVDVEFMAWFTNRFIEMEKLTGVEKEVSNEADRAAAELVGAAGYDAGEYSKMIERLPSSYSLLDHLPSNGTRTEALAKLKGEGGFGMSGGKVPALPKGLDMPRGFD
ncbi:MAG: hypothetical protein JNK82_33675 [Myxococcaceae bacterium]|nr:hypothetical protein [Myxococcaceae bacterium]